MTFKNAFLIFRASRELSTAWNVFLSFEVFRDYGNKSMGLYLGVIHKFLGIWLQAL